MLGGRAIKNFAVKLSGALRRTADEWPNQNDQVVVTMKVIAFVLDNVIKSYDEE